jgi:hypothetical protein
MNAFLRDEGLSPFPEPKTNTQALLFSQSAVVEAFTFSLSKDR